MFNAKQTAQTVFSLDAAITTLANGRPIVAESFKGVTYEVFTERQKDVIAALVESGKSANPDAARKMLNRVLDECDIEKPKATTEKAVKVAADRANKEQERAKTVRFLTGKEAPTAADLQHVLSTKKDLTAANITHIAEAMKKAAREETKHADKAANEQLKALRDEVRQAANKCADIKLLQSVLAVLNGEAKVTAPKAKAA